MQENDLAEKAVEILLVEDNPNDVELTLHAFKLSRITNRLHIVRDGAEALDFLFHRGAYHHRDRASDPKVILLDLKLPKVDGIEVLRQAKTDQQTKAIPIVVLTSSEEGSDLKACYALGANSYIVKPVDFDQFSRVVSELGLYWLVLNRSPEQTKASQGKET